MHANAFFAPPHQPMAVIAHRGGSLEAPENTLYALHKSAQQGACFLEVDVGCTRDGVATILHDDTLLRTTGAQGRLEDFYASELGSLRAHRPTPSPETMAAMVREGLAQAPDFAEHHAMAHDERFMVPSLKQALQLPQARFMLELKQTDRPDELIDAVLREVHAADAAERVALASFEMPLLQLAQRRAPSLPRIGVAETMAEARQMLQLPIACLAVHTGIAQTIRAAVPPHVALWCWTVYTPAQSERMRIAGVDGVITDAPAAVLASFGRETAAITA